MSKLRQTWIAYQCNTCIELSAEMEAAITDAEAEIARLTRERDEAITAGERQWQGWLKAERERDEARQMLREWEEHAGPFKDAEIARLTRERDEARSRALDEAAAIARDEDGRFTSSGYWPNEKALIETAGKIADAILALKGDSHD